MTDRISHYVQSERTFTEDELKELIERMKQEPLMFFAPPPPKNILEVVRWIPVDEELPDNNDVVLAVYECGEYGVDYTTAWREFDKWCCWDDRVNPWDEPIAWMRIPEFKRNDGDERMLS